MNLKAEKRSTRRGLIDHLRPTVPHRLQATPAGTTVVLHWRKSSDDTGVAKYEVQRDGRRIATPKSTTVTDRSTKAGTTYVYRVRAIDRTGRKGNWSAKVTIHLAAAGGFVQATPSGPAGPPGATGDVPVTVPVVPTPDPTPDPPPPPPPPPVLKAADVDRLFWRAGFGPTPADRTKWTGKLVSELVDWFLDTPGGTAATTTPALVSVYDNSTNTSSFVPIDPTVSDQELVAAWLEAMRLATNPFVERLAFFWHRHWAVSRESGEIDQRHMVEYTKRLRKYADLGVGANPDASFRDLAQEMTKDDAAMNIYLDSRYNQWYSGGHFVPNENYGREFMELFALGVSDPASDPPGAPSYSQDDVHSLARAFTGFQVQDDETKPNYGVVNFDLQKSDRGMKILFGVNHDSRPASTEHFDATQAVDLVLNRPQHAPYLIRKLWAEFIPTPIPAGTLATLVEQYRGNGKKIKPLVKAILNDPALLASPDEPTMIKPPIVFAIGVLRALGAPILANTYKGLIDGLEQMEQVPYFPPNVSGWEGGLSWMNTSTARARFDFVLRCLDMKYNAYPNSTALADPGREASDLALNRAYAACGSPWLSADGKAALLSYAQTYLKGTLVSAQPSDRRQRQYTLIALILGGPDGQVM